MNKKKAFTIIFLLILLITNIFLYSSETVETIAILPIKIAGGANSEAFSVALNGSLLTELKKTNKLKVIDRENIDKVMRELQISQSDLSQSANAIRIGKLLTAKFLLSVSIAHDNGTYIINASVIQTDSGNVVKSINPINIKQIAETRRAGEAIVNRLLNREADIAQETDYTGIWIVTKTANYFKNHGLTYKKLVLTDEGNYEIHLINNVDSLVVFHGRYSIEGNKIDFRHSKIFINDAPSYIPHGTKILGTVYIVEGKLYFTVSNIDNKKERLDAMDETYRNIARKKL